MSVNITCFGGANEIGGNKILLEEDGKRLLMDFGMAFGRSGGYFDGVLLKERSARGLLDPLALGLVPPLRGLLRDDLVPAMLGQNIEVAEVPPTGRLRVSRRNVSLRPEAIDAFWRRWQTRFPQAHRDLRGDGPVAD